MRSLHISRYKYGFTIVELLITLVVFTFVIGMIYATYTMGIFMWKTTETRLWTVQEARMSLERIIREARGARRDGIEIGEKLIFKNINGDTISFEKSGDKILRRVNNRGNNIVATSVKSFLVEAMGSSYKVTITFNNGHTVSGIFTPRNK
ncbi:MAG: competence type IV pilus minor pilin ComGF [bacterium]